jgi:hypothetical protein
MAALPPTEKIEFIPFNEWKRENPDLVKEIEEECENERCPTCDNTKSCVRCDQSCPDCGEDYVEDRLIEIYKEKKAEQIKKLKEWNDAVAAAEAL